MSLCSFWFTAVIQVQKSNKRLRTLEDYYTPTWTWLDYTSVAKKCILGVGWQFLILNGLFHPKRTWCLPGWWAVVSSYEFLTFRLHLWKESSEVLLELLFTSETAVEAAPLKMTATYAGETSGTHNLRPRLTSSEDTMYIDAGRESLNQYIFHTKFINLYHYEFLRGKIWFSIEL